MTIRGCSFGNYWIDLVGDFPLFLLSRELWRSFVLLVHCCQSYLQSYGSLEILAVLSRLKSRHWNVAVVRQGVFNIKIAEERPSTVFIKEKDVFWMVRSLLQLFFLSDGEAIKWKYALLCSWDRMILNILVLCPSILPFFLLSLKVQNYYSWAIKMHVPEMKFR